MGLRLEPGLADEDRLQLYMSSNLSKIDYFSLQTKGYCAVDDVALQPSNVSHCLLMLLELLT